MSGAVTSFTYDTSGRVRTVTDSDGYVVTTDYDALDRPVRLLYPDGTYEEMLYSRLDMAARIDRKGRTTRYFHDALGRLTGTRDPLGRTIGQTWCSCGALDALVDGKGNRTSWVRDVRGRVTQEVRANGSGSTYAYGAASGRLLTVTDAMEQVTTYSYALDDAVLGMTFTNAAVATPSVSFTYEAGYPRMATMVDGTGTTAYAYVPAGTAGAGQIATVDGPLSNDTITYTYDALGRVTNRDINGTGVTWGFDALGRVTSEVNVLGTFTYGYDGVTSRLASVSYPNGQTSAYSYYGGTADRRLETIHHKYPGGATLSKFDYTYDAAANILTWLQQVDSDPPVLWVYGYDAADQLTSAVKGTTGPSPEILASYRYGYDATANRTFEQIDDAITLATYDNMNRLLAQVPGGSLAIEGLVNEAATVTIEGVPATVTAQGDFRGSLSVTGGTHTFTIVATDASGNSRTESFDVGVTGQARSFAYDANGNMTGDAIRTFEWDARDGLVAVNIESLRSEFNYDGHRRRRRTIEKDAGAVQSDTTMLWCETRICEERAPSGDVLQRQLSFGQESTSSPSFFVADHLGSIRAAADGAGMVTARYQFDPWGRRSLETGNDEAAFGLSGHVNHRSSGLELSWYRPYDPEFGRWIADDPARIAGRSGNIAAYVDNNPLGYVDPYGLYKVCCRSVVSTAFLKCHCWISLSNGDTIGAYREGSRLRRRRNSPDDKPTRSGSRCNDFGGGSCTDERLVDAWNEQPEESGYSFNNTSNSAVSEALMPEGVVLPRCAQGRRYYYDMLFQRVMAIGGR
jgi:RHS repeat-associated protein